jgi:hypothetical protein
MVIEPTVIAGSLDFTAPLPQRCGGDSEGNVFTGKRPSAGMVARVQCIEDERRIGLS